MLHTYHRTKVLCNRRGINIAIWGYLRVLCNFNMSMPPPTYNSCPNCSSLVHRKGGIYCNRACWEQAHRVTRTCPNCGRTFTTPLCNVKRRRMIACSRECRDLLSCTHRVIEHNGVTYRHRDRGYYLSKKRKVLHRVIWEEHHGPIPKDSIVRHLDGDHDNNDISNLQLLPLRDVPTLLLSKTPPPCLQCDRPARTRGLCTRHYQQLRAQEKGGWKEVKRPRAKADQHN